jgi:hypothetical protein
MASKLGSAGARQKPAKDIALEDRAVLDLAASALFDDPILLGPALLLLAGRPCASNCHSAPRDWL